MKLTRNVLFTWISEEERRLVRSMDISVQVYDFDSIYMNEVDGMIPVYKILRTSRAALAAEGLREPRPQPHRPA